MDGKIEEVIDISELKLGDVSEFGEIVKCEKCGDASVEYGVRLKGKRVRFVHEVSKWRKGSRRKNLYTKLCTVIWLPKLVSIADNGTQEMMKGSDRGHENKKPRKASFKRKKDG